MEHSRRGVGGGISNRRRGSCRLNLLPNLSGRFLTFLYTRFVVNDRTNINVYIYIYNISLSHAFFFFLDKREIHFTEKPVVLDTDRPMGPVIKFRAIKPITATSKVLRAIHACQYNIS